MALFQVALVFGAPMGEYAFGGQHKGKLPARFRFASAVAILIYAAIAGHYLAQIGVLPKLLPAELNDIGNWALVGFNVVGLIMNSISRSKLERQLWVPVLLLLTICSALVALHI
ncbi:hypothetical protein [Rhodoluna sp.]|uniref:hypothetical protein n=1 Tax=Rhodoluna sp. TaxID=1969481 RepID=UPI0025EDDE68|nr:hypothetical protein [Rhodoluna sp.]